MKKICIIGGGFSGTMTAVHLIQHAKQPLELTIFTGEDTFTKGIAFDPYSKHHLLNVPAGSMSAFQHKPSHFLNWLMLQTDYIDKNKSIVSNSFVPRYLFGRYLSEIWEETLRSEPANLVKINILKAMVTDLDIDENTVKLTPDKGEKYIADYCVIASGNHVPANPRIHDKNFYSSKNYYQNPWKIASVDEIDLSKPVLIIGNGLTMVDTVLGLMEKKFRSTIYSISPNGFNILPHRHTGLKYTALTDELTGSETLYDLVKLFNKHIKILRHSGLTAEPAVDSLRPFTQKIWQGLSAVEKRIFMGRLRHMWGIVRSRIPAHIHDKMQQLRLNGILRIYAGKILTITEKENNIEVEYSSRGKQGSEKIIVSAVINCSGPQADLMRLEEDFLKNCLIKDIAVQDTLKLGIEADPSTFQIIGADGKKHRHLFTIGTNLKGVLWETIAVNELRDQAEKVAKYIVKL